MRVLTMTEVELLAGLLMRAGVTQVEAAWCNEVLNALRANATEQQALDAVRPKEEDSDPPTK